MNLERGPAVAAWVCAVSAAMLSAACASDPGDSPDPPDAPAYPEPEPDEAVVVGEDPWILVHDFSAGAEALLHLELEYLPEQGCLLVHGIDPESGEVAYSGVPVWPEGVQPLDEDADEGVGVLVPDHGPLVDGDTFTAGGAPGAEEEPPAGVDLPEQGCDGEGYVALNADSISEG